MVKVKVKEVYDRSGGLKCLLCLSRRLFLSANCEPALVYFIFCLSFLWSLRQGLSRGEGRRR